MTERDMSFEESMARLEQIVAQLEAGDHPLDRALSLYEEGVVMMKRCASMLDRAEQKVKLLQVSDTGEVRELPFQNQEG